MRERAAKVLSVDEIVFPITDWSPERRFIGPFDRAFATV